MCPSIRHQVVFKSLNIGVLLLLIFICSGDYHSSQWIGSGNTEPRSALFVFSSHFRLSTSYLTGSISLSDTARLLPLLACFFSLAFMPQLAFSESVRFSTPHGVNRLGEMSSMCHSTFLYLLNSQSFALRAGGEFSTPWAKQLDWN